jgi:hypothetical protein
MNALRWLSVLLLALALVAGTSLWLQRQAATQLRAEIAQLREDGRDLAKLRAENQRLAAAQPSEAELARMRSDHAAVLRMRAELEKTKGNLQVSERALAAPASNAGAALVPARAWTNAGRATPDATLETLLWIRTRGDADSLASILTFAPTRHDADQIFAGLPDGIRQEYGNVEQLIARFLLKEATPNVTRIVGEKQIDLDHVELGVEVRDPGAGGRQILMLPMQRGEDGWRWAISAGVVRDSANAARVQTQTTR